MAGFGSHLLVLDEKFCQCPICLQQYKDPKLLPCLHRYCRDCLKQLIGRNQGVSMLSCPECRHDCEIPADGIAGFKTDFYMKNIIEYIQLQKSLENEEMRHCCNSSKKVKVSAYCFECDDFLCQECYNLHLTKKMLKDHKKHTFSLEDIKSKHWTLQSPLLMKGTPRCQSHPEYLCRLCCRTCNNLPICVNCTYGSHENHSIKEVSMLAAQARETLRMELTTLGQSKERIYDLEETINSVKKELVSDIKEKKETFQRRYEWNVEKMKIQMTNMAEYYETKQSEIEKIKENDLMEMRNQMEEEISEIKAKYDNFCKEIMNNSKLKLTDLKQQYNKDIENSRRKLSNLESEFHQFIATIEERLDERSRKLNEIAEQVDSTRKRFENLTATASFVLDTKNDWTAIRCIPDIQMAIEPLNTNMNIKFPELEMMSCVSIITDIKENEDSPEYIEGIEADDWWTDGIFGSDDGSIIITGWDYNCQVSSICHINLEGDVLRQNAIGSSGQWDRYSAYLSQYKVITTCNHNEISVYDIREESKVSNMIPDVIGMWPADCSVTCIAADPVKNHIFVKGEESDVYVLDHELHFLRTLTLPEMIERVNDMTVNESNLIVCSDSNSAAYILNIEGSECKLLHKLPQPFLGEDDWKPISVCTDKNGYIYILWESGVGLQTNVFLVQYSPYKYQLMIVKLVNTDADFIATVETNQEEKLLITTVHSKQLFIYDIGCVRVL